MRSLYLIPGFILTIFGLVFALQGAYVLPTSFMRGPEWIAIGFVIFLAGLGLDFLGIGRRPSSKPA